MNNPDDRISAIDKTKIPAPETSERFEFCLIKSRKGVKRLHSVLEFVECMAKDGISTDGLGIVLLLLDKGYLSEGMKATTASQGLLYVAERSYEINSDTGAQYFTREPFFTEKGMRLFASLMKECSHE